MDDKKIEKRKRDVKKKEKKKKEMTFFYEKKKGKKKKIIFILYFYLVDPASDICLFKRLSHANIRAVFFFGKRCSVDCFV